MTFVLLLLSCLLSVSMLVVLDITSFALNRKGWRRFLATFLLFYAQVVGTTFLLGLATLLYNVTLALLNVAITTALILFVRKQYGSELFTKYRNNLRGSLRRLCAARKQNKFLLILGVLGALVLLWVTFIGLIFPAVDWDGNAYHLAYAAQMLQNHSLHDAPASMAWLIGYPKGGEFIQAWTILLAHNDTLADLSQLSFVLLGIVSLYAIAVQLGVSKHSARYAAMLLIFTPSLLNQLTTAYIDVMLAGVFFAALALVLQRKYEKLDFVLIGITFSLLISIKSSGIYLVAGLLLLLLWSAYKQYGLSLKRYLLPAGLLVTPMLFGLYWYVKNIVLYGTPIYPFGFQIAGHTLFKGIDYSQWSAGIAANLPDTTVGRLWYTWSEHNPDPFAFRYDYDSNFFGLGVIWFTMLVPAIAFGVYLALRHRHYRLLAVLGLLAAILMVFPTNFSPRYTLFILSAGIVCFGLVLDHLHHLGRLAVKTIVFAMVIVTLCVNITFWSYQPSTVLGQLKSIAKGHGQHGDKTLFDISFGDSYRYARDHVKAGETIVYTDTYWVYPLWNGDFSNRVEYIDATNRDDWYKQVKAGGADYIFVLRDPTIKQSTWASDTFKQVVYSDEKYEILRVTE